MVYVPKDTVIDFMKKVRRAGFLSRYLDKTVILKLAFSLSLDRARVQLENKKVR